MWTRFPNEEEISGIVGNAKGIEGDAKEPAVPFQFTLAVMDDIYNSMAGEEVRTLEQALRSGVRAIAFFSWENETRVFLTRRCVPRFFGFLSYSHVPYGWGALGCALCEIEDTKGKYSGFSIVEDITQRPALLPYLREAFRIKYKAALVLPIFQTGANLNIDSLLGAFVFYLPSRDSLPRETDTDVKGRLTHLSFAMASALTRHYKALKTFLPDEGWDQALNFGDNYSGELTIRLHKDGNLPFLKRLSEIILVSLTGFDFHAVRKKNEDDRTSVIAVASRFRLDQRIFENQILNVVGVACHQCGCEEYVSYQFRLPNGQNNGSLLSESLGTNRSVIDQGCSVESC